VAIASGKHPVSIPNLEVKPDSADGTATGRSWESRTPPDIHTVKGHPTGVALNIYPSTRRPRKRPPAGSRAYGSPAQNTGSAAPHQLSSRHQFAKPASHPGRLNASCRSFLPCRTRRQLLPGSSCCRCRIRRALGLASGCREDPCPATRWGWHRSLRDAVSMRAHLVVERGLGGSALFIGSEGVWLVLGGVGSTGGGLCGGRCRSTMGGRGGRWLDLRRT
jgi:hypothetical protein